MIEPVLIERFALLFAGLTRAKGRYVSTTDPSQYVAGDKTKGKATTVQEAVTLDDYRKHLEGELSLGIVPIRDDGTCVFGAIDIDQYAGLDHAGLVKKIAELGVPANVCRSKSGGAHVYVCVAEPGVKAPLLIEYLKKLRTKLGINYLKAREIFPKQAKQVGGIGNWINIPYFGESARRAVKDAATDFTLEEFCTIVVRVPPTEFTVAQVGGEDLIPAELPPCLERLMGDGIPAGMRNEALFNYTVFAAKKFQLDRSSTVKILNVINERVCQPPVATRELTTTLDSVLKHEYNYRCDQSPLVDVCNKTTCAMRPYGPQASMRPGNIPEVERIEIRGEESGETQYAIKLKIAPRTVVMDSKTLFDYEAFRLGVVDTLHIRLPSVKKMDWDAYMTARFEALKESVRVAPERTKKGMMLATIEDWIKYNSTKDGGRFNLGIPFVEEGRVYVSLLPAVNRLRQVITKIEFAQAVVLLEDNGWEKITKNIDGRLHDGVWTRVIDASNAPSEVQQRATQVDGHIVVETPKSVPAGNLEEYEWDKYAVEES